MSNTGDWWQVRRLRRGFPEVIDTHREWRGPGRRPVLEGSAPYSHLHFSAPSVEEGALASHTCARLTGAGAYCVPVWVLRAVDPKSLHPQDT